MNIKSTSGLAALIWIALSILNPQLSTLAQGSLTPPGAPAATMKSLQQVEPRTPISSLPFNIASNGSYYLTTNLTGVSGTNGLTITAKDVHVDLRGYSLTGVAGSLSGILVSGSQYRFSLENGTIRQWGSNAVTATSSGTSHIRNVFANDNGSSGIRVGTGSALDHSLIEDCRSSQNVRNGIDGGGRCLIVRCITVSNGVHGVEADFGSIVTECISEDNGNNGFNLFARCLVSRCSASDNGQNGIQLTDNGQVRDCLVNDNVDNGILVFSKCQVAGNNCIGGSTTANFCGVHAVEGDNRIEDNNVVDTAFGFRIDATGNFIVRNTCAGCGTNFALIGTQTIGPIVTSLGTIATNSPWANFGF